MCIRDRSQAVEGVVCISASESVAVYLLPEVLRQLRDKAPGIVIDLVTSDALSDLRRREADIAVRHVRPEQPDLIGRWIREASAGFYASKAWVAQNGHPRTAEEALRQRFVGSDRSGRYLAFLRQHGLPIDAAHFACYAESTVSYGSLVRNGLGIGPMMDDIARTMPDVVRVLDEVPPVLFPIWLVTHRELRTARRIRLVFDFLAEALGAQPPPER